MSSLNFGYQPHVNPSLIIILTVMVTMQCTAHLPFPRRDPRMSNSVDACHGPRLCTSPAKSAHPPSDSGCSTCCKQHRFLYGGGCQQELMLPRNQYVDVCLCYDKELPAAYVKGKGLTKADLSKTASNGKNIKSNLTPPSLNHPRKEETQRRVTAGGRERIPPKTIKKAIKAYKKTQ